MGVVFDEIQLQQPWTMAEKLIPELEERSPTSAQKVREELQLPERGILLGTIVLIFPFEDSLNFVVFVRIVIFYRLVSAYRLTPQAGLFFGLFVNLSRNVGDPAAIIYH